MSATVLLQLLLLATTVAGTSSSARAQAGEKVLFVQIYQSQYSATGTAVFSTLIAAGADATHVVVTGAGGQVVTALAAGSYQQIWFYDIAEGANAYPADYDAIAAWFAAHPTQEIICDGRFISSYWSGRHATEGQRLTENYYTNLATRGGGLVLATDDNAYHTFGANDLAARIGLNPFFGNFTLVNIPVDTGNVLMTTPNNMGATLFDDSTPGQTPYGLQPNGQILYTLAYHSGNPETPGISTTIAGTLGLLVDFTYTKSVTRVGGGMAIAPGDQLEFTLALQHSMTSEEGANNVVISDAIPSELSYVPGSLSVLGASLTDIVDADAGEVVGPNVTVRIGAFPLGTTTSVKFRVSTSATPDTATNTAHLDFVGTSSSFPQEFDSNPITVAWAEPVNTCSDAVAPGDAVCSAGTKVVYAIVDLAGGSQGTVRCLQTGSNPPICDTLSDGTTLKVYAGLYCSAN